MNSHFAPTGRPPDEALKTTISSDSQLAVLEELTKWAKEANKFMTSLAAQQREQSELIEKLKKQKQQ